MSITSRITILCLIVFGVGFYLFVRQEVEETTQRYREATEEPLIDIANVLALLVTEEWEHGDKSFTTLRRATARTKDIELSAPIFDFIKHSIELRVLVTDDRGMILFDSEEGKEEGKDYSEWNDIRRTLIGEYGARSSRDEQDPSASTMYVAAPIRIQGKIQGALSVAKSNATANQFILATQRNIWSLGLTLLGVGTLIAAFLSIYVARPLRKLILYVQGVRDGRRGIDPPKAGGEIGELTLAFEEMREALEGKRYIERYVQTLTHELKSPVTAIRGAVEVLHETDSPEAQQHFLENIDREVERIQGLADQLLVLSSLQTQRVVNEREPVLLNTILDEVVVSLSGELEAGKISMQRSDGGECQVSGNRFWLQEAIRNILRNAVEFSPNGSTIEVRLDKNPEGIVFSVSDCGPGIPAWALEKVTDQFFSLPRPSSQRRSSGLGLSIVKEVVELHGGHLLVSNRENGGAEIGFRLHDGVK